MASRDIAALSVHVGMGMSLDAFRGAVVAAEKLGHSVTIRDIRDPGGNLSGIVASCEVAKPAPPSPTPETETP